MLNKKLGIVYGCFFALFMAAYVMAGSFPAASGRYPKLICILGMAISVYMFIAEVLEDRRLAKNQEALQEKKDKLAAETLKKAEVMAIILFLILMSLYILGIFKVGYYVSTIIFMIVCMSVLKKRFSVVYAVVALAFTIFIFVVFSNVLHIVTPKGLLF